MSLPEWAVEGGQAVTVNFPTFGPPHLTAVTIDRVTATQAVIGTRRFRLVGVELRESGAYGDILIPRDDPRLAGWQWHRKSYKAEREAKDAARRFGVHANIDNHDALVAALAEWRTLLEARP